MLVITYFEQFVNTSSPIIRDWSLLYSVICSPDFGPDRMLDFYIKIGIPEGTEDDEESFHGGSGRLCLAAGWERDPGRRFIRIVQARL